MLLKTNIENFGAGMIPSYSMKIKGLLGYALESPKPLVRASGFPCVTGNQFGRYGIEYQRLLDEAIEEFPREPEVRRLNRKVNSSR